MSNADQIHSQMLIDNYWEKSLFITAVDNNGTKKLILKEYLQALFSDLHFLHTANGFLADFLGKATNKKTKDVPLPDFTMPKMSGIEATKKIMAIAKNNNKYKACIVALIAGVAKEDKERALPAEMNEFVQKLFSIKHFTNVYRKLCNE